MILYFKNINKHNNFRLPTRDHSHMSYALTGEEKLFIPNMTIAILKPFQFSVYVCVCSVKFLNV